MAKHEKRERIALIGEELKITNAKNKTLIGFCGTVNGETRNTITIKTQTGNKTIIKDQVEIDIKGKKIQGKNITGRVEERIKQ